MQNTGQRKEVKSGEERWSYLKGRRSGIEKLCEEYASWTLPYVFSPEHTDEKTELQIAKDSIGAKGVNHLSNKIVSTLFPGQRLFFRLHLDAAAEQGIAQIANAAREVNPGADAMLAAARTEVEKQLLGIENQATEYMDFVSYRPQAVNAAKLLIVTGNALMFHPPGKPVQVYSLKDFCIMRDLSGEVVEIMTRESKSFETFHPDVQEQIWADRNSNRRRNRKTSPDSDRDDVVIYSRIVLEDTGKYYLHQWADTVKLDTTGQFWPKATLPWIPLTWNLIRGEDYGRGLVADFAGAFHALNVLSGSLLNIAAIMGDIKFLVNPQSLLDLAALTKSAPGSYHSGVKDDLTTVQVDKMAEAQFIMAMIERYERQISEAFLLFSGITRNAERVTAEEIRAQANELETSNGGIYSRLAASWQVPTSAIVLDQIGFQGLENGVKPQVITGLDSLSRAGELDNLRLFLADLGMLQAIPDDVRLRIRISDLIAVFGINRQVEYQRFVKSEEEVAEEQQAALQQQQQLLAQQQQGEAQTEVAKQVAKDTNG